MNDVAIYTCQTWEDFVRQSRTGRFPGDRLFRGHRDPTWKLSSRWERMLESVKDGSPNRNVKNVFEPGGYEKFRDGFLERFKHAAWEVGLTEKPSSLESDEWWALARHHGLVTPLLDWSYSPYVAAYIAFTDSISAYGSKTTPGYIRQDELREDQHITIWELNFVQSELGVPGEFEHLTPRPIGARRQIMQRGSFTRLTHDIYIDLGSYLGAKAKLNYLSRYNIALTALPAAITDMRLMGLSYVTLFQDLDGAANEANAAPYINSLSARTT